MYTVVVPLLLQIHYFNAEGLCVLLLYRVTVALHKGALYSIIYSTVNIFPELQELFILLAY